MAFELNSQVIITQSGKAPITATVCKVTKSGQFYTDRTGPARFKLQKWSNDRAEEIGKCYSGTRGAQPHTDEKFDDLLQMHQKREADKAAERQERDEREAARQAEWEAKVAAIRATFPDVNALELSIQSPLPDGSRVYAYTFQQRVITWTDSHRDGEDGPLVQQHHSEDQGWCWVVITCKDVEDYDWKSGERIKMIEAALTYRTARSSSFSSVSTERYATEAEAVYQCLAYAYHRC